MSAESGAIAAGRGGQPIPRLQVKGRAHSLADAAHFRLLQVLALAVLATVALIGWETFSGALPAMRAFGWRFLVGTEWDPVAERFGALPYLYGTAVSSALALLLALPLGLGTAVYLAELAPSRVGSVVAFVVELLASIPSIVYGLWGVFVLAPFLRSVLEPWLIAHFGFLPLFQGYPFGIGMLNAAIVLAVMVMPTIVSISREILLSMPRSLRESALALGATRAEAIATTLDAARPGILGADPGAGASAGRDLGGDHGDREFQPDLGVAARPQRHHGERHRQRVHRGHQQAPSVGVDRDRLRAAGGHHAGELDRPGPGDLEHGGTS